ncbi:energy transducer TonB [Bacteriovoracales bacterium]|nr:energy transducer TonB [Bacteriovoracales bacterium]
MKIIKPFLLSLLINASFIGLMNLFFNYKKKTQPPNIALKNKPFKMRLHFKKVMQVEKTKQTFNKNALLNKTQKMRNRKKKKVELAKQKKIKNKQKKQIEKKLGNNLKRKKETKKISPFRPSIISKIKGLIKGKVPYPYAAVVKNMEGKVHYTLTLSPKGETSHYKMTQSSGFPLLDETVREFFLKSPLEGQISLSHHTNKPLVILDHIQFKIEGL